MSKRKNRHGKVFQTCISASAIFDEAALTDEVEDIACILRFMAEAVPLWIEYGDYDAAATADKGLRLSLEGLAERLEVVSAAMTGKSMAVEAD